MNVDKSNPSHPTLEELTFRAPDEAEIVVNKSKLREAGFSKTETAILLMLANNRAVDYVALNLGYEVSEIHEFMNKIRAKIEALKDVKGEEEDFVTELIHLRLAVRATKDQLRAQTPENLPVIQIKRSALKEKDFTDRQIDILEVIATGTRSNVQVGAALGIASKTVSNLKTEEFLENASSSELGLKGMMRKLLGKEIHEDGWITALIDLGYAYKAPPLRD